MADKKSEHQIEETATDAADEPRVDVLTNAVRRLDNRYRGRPNDPSLIGQDMPEEEEDEDADPDAEDADDPEKDDEWPEPKGTKLW